MTAITPARNTIQIEETRYRAGVSEATLTRVGAAINYIMNRIFYPVRFVYGGFFRETLVSDGEAGTVLFNGDTNLSYYYVAVDETGAGGITKINFDVIDDDGTVLGTLFDSDGVQIGATTSQSNVRVGKDVTNTQDIEVNTGSLTTKELGTLQYTSFTDGQSLRPKIESNGNSAKNLTIEIRFQEV